MNEIFTIIVIATIIIVLLPFYKNTQKEYLLEQSVDPIDQLQKQKEALLQSIRELDFDFETGKISSTDYKDLRASIESKTVQTLKDLEQAQQQWKEMERSS